MLINSDEVQDVCSNLETTKLSLFFFFFMQFDFSILKFIWCSRLSSFTSKTKTFLKMLKHVSEWQCV